MLAADYTSFLSPPLGYAIFAVAFVAGALVLFPFHRLFRRLRAPVGGDSGRLGIVERFTLGRQRELVVIRRDDAEHFVMIGRSTDIVIEPILDHPTRLEYAESDREWLQEQAEHAAHRQRMRTYLDLTKRLIHVEGLIPLAALSAAAGAGTGVICGLFRLALEKADRFRNLIPQWWQHEGAALAASLSAYLVRRYSMLSAGSRIPQVELAIHGDIPPAPFILLPVKFFGGLLAIGAGLALGREGPSVQMGATFAYLLGRSFRRSADDCRTLPAAGAGAGLAAVFNAPLAGSAFVLEELLRKFEIRNAIAALGASGSAIVVARLFTGQHRILR